MLLHAPIGPGTEDILSMKTGVPCGKKSDANGTKRTIQRRPDAGHSHPETKIHH